jgi:hypothetical protein
MITQVTDMSTTYFLRGEVVKTVQQRNNPSSNLVDFGEILKIVLNEVKLIEIYKPLV